MDPGGKYRFTHPGWCQIEATAEVASFQVDGTDTVPIGSRLNINKQKSGTNLNESACKSKKGTIEQITVAGKATKFCKAPSDNGLGALFAGFPQVASTTLGVAYTVILQTDPAKAQMPQTARDALASMKP